MSNQANKGDITTGNITGNNIVIGGNQNITGDMVISGSSSVSDERHLRDYLTQLLADSRSKLAELPPEQENEKTQIAVALEDVESEAQKTPPDKRRLEIRGEALVQAAKNLAQVAPLAVEIARTLLLLNQRS